MADPESGRERNESLVFEFALLLRVSITSGMILFSIISMSSLCVMEYNKIRKSFCFQNDDSLVPDVGIPAFVECQAC